MVGLIVFCIIAVATIAAFLFAWLYYQRARDKERMFLLERGDSLEEVDAIQNKNRFKFIFPWLKMGVVTGSMSISFLVIAFLVYWLENDLELLKGFLITAILGACLSVGMIINHCLGDHDKSHHG